MKIFISFVRLNLHHYVIGGEISHITFESRVQTSKTLFLRALIGVMNQPN